MEFCDSERNRFILACIVSLQEIARFTWASRTDRSRDDEVELERSIFDNERDEFINESDGKNPRK